MIDFTLKTYRQLLLAINAGKHRPITFHQFLTRRPRFDKYIILRHDVDRKPKRALAMAQLEKEMGIPATYFFRTGSRCFIPHIIENIARLGHEIGYHYEDLSWHQGNFERAIQSFGENLDRLRKYCPVDTICMHGSPLSSWDNRRLWQKYDYHDFGVLGEPYMDFPFNGSNYLTDTGRRWNGEDVSVRDLGSKGLNIRHTEEIIAALDLDQLPQGLMINIHPERWTHRWWPWLHQLMWQKLKNVIKVILIKRRRR